MTNGPDLIHAPWSAEQVTALNAFQHHGRMHPFTCGATHDSGQSPVLIATHSGWVCPDPQCVYRQDWAHAFMAEGAPVRIVTDPPATAAAPMPPPADRSVILAEAAELAERLMDERYGPDCSRHTDELGDSWTPLLSDDLPDGGLCAKCGVDVLITQQGAAK